MSRIVFSPEQRSRLREALLRHRHGYPQTDNEYVSNVLGIALGTYKKCIEEGDADELALLRRTVIALLKATRIDPQKIGLDLVLPTAADQFGGYEPDQYSHLVGSYFLYRRSFQSGHNIVRAVVDISIDEQKRCLRYSEYNKYFSDSGLPDENEYFGEIYMNDDRSLISMLTILDGQMRLIMTQAAVRTGQGTAATLPRGSIKFRGGLFTHGRGRGVWQPTYSAIVISSIPEREWKSAREKCCTLLADDADFAEANREIKHAEDFATVTTPMMYRPPQK